MPAWITSLLREDTPLPMPPVVSATITPWPRKASARAIASPTTPAPMTRMSMSGPQCQVLNAKRRLESRRFCRFDNTSFLSRDRHLRGGGAHVGIDMALEALEVL